MASLPPVDQASVSASPANEPVTVAPCVDTAMTVAPRSDARRATILAVLASMPEIATLRPSSEPAAASAAETAPSAVSASTRPAASSGASVAVALMSWPRKAPSSSGSTPNAASTMTTCSLG